MLSRIVLLRETKLLVGAKETLFDQYMYTYYIICKKHLKNNIFMTHFSIHETSIVLVTRYQFYCPGSLQLLYIIHYLRVTLLLGIVYKSSVTVHITLCSSRHLVPIIRVIFEYFFIHWCTFVVGVNF